MPKIRDLGISHIPLTMRPPEVGPGGAFHMPGGPDAAFPMFLTETCNDYPSCETNSGGQCVPSGCPQSCGDTCGQSGPACGDTCPGNTAQCPDTCVDSCTKGGQNASGLEHDAIIQLKQHLQDRLGTQLQM